MTAEIAIMNAHGIALAADSAVTTEQNRKEKIYNSANKLFMLSKYRPVAIMIYGNASINGIPWEIVIKEFRRRLKDAEYGSLKEYCDKFLQFLANDFFPKERCDYWFERQARELLYYAKGNLETDVDKHTKESGAIEQAEIPNFCDKSIHSTLEHLINSPDLGFDSAIARLRTPERVQLTERLIKEVFENIPLKPETVSYLSDLSIKWHNKDWFVPLSGIVIAGFGKNDICPSLYEYHVEGAVENLAKYRLGDTYEIGNKCNSLVVPFAEKSAVWTFCKGIDPDMESTIGRSIENVLCQDYPQKVIDIIKSSYPKVNESVIKKTIEDLGKGCAKGVMDKLNEHKQINFITPLVNTASMLPLEEMAAMAETFVNLSSIRKKFTLQSETVGGPIDVCVISKSDGFIWIKRKHYFEPKLNQHFFQNYFRE